MKSLVQIVSERVLILRRHTGSRLYDSTVPFITKQLEFSLLDVYNFILSIVTKWFFIRLSVKIFYYFYFFIPSLLLFVYLNVMKSISVAVLCILCQRSLRIKSFCIHIKCIIDIIVNSSCQLYQMKLSEILVFIVNATNDILNQLSNKYVKYNHPNTDEFSDLVYYEETEVLDKSSTTNWEQLQKRMKKVMHNFIPPTLFRVGVRVHKTSDSSSDKPSYNTSDDLILLNEADSPVSFPATPFSRARVMNRSTERVSSVMFTARDKLRLDEQTSSNDEFSRIIASDQVSKGYYAALDPKQASDGLALSCGNHCAFKIGDALCCSCRSMIAIRSNVYTYFEFSITASFDVFPMVSIGISNRSCPLNVMIGSWDSSVGLYSDGQLLVDSKWYQNTQCNSNILGAGVTVGVLVHLPDRSSVNDLPIIKFNVNGHPYDYDIPSSVLMKFNNGNNNEFYPSLSILSEGTRVWVRFCEADIVFRSRKSIGAPLGKKIYSLDGSRLLGDCDI